VSSFLQKAGEVQPHTSYLVCATARSGSTLLCEALKNTGLAGQPEEYFLPLNEDFFSKELWGVSSYADYIARVIKEGTSSNGVFGAKMMWAHFDDFVGKLRSIPGYERLPVPELLSTVFPNLHYIWITRSDKVRQAVSYAKAIQSDVWAIVDETSKISLSGSRLRESYMKNLKRSDRIEASDKPLCHSSFTKELEFDFAHIDFLLGRIKSHEAAWQRYFAENGIKPYTVVYEDLAVAYEQTAIEILHELNVSVSEALKILPRSMKRQADTLSEEWIQHYHEFNRLIACY
jgi:trehalose 2-sulfotransferase